MADEFNINEWLLDEYIAKREALQDLMRRHEEIVNHLADVCRRNDRMQTVGNELVECVHRLMDTSVIDQSQCDRLEDVIQKWMEANV